jgi:hypothetical protein
MLHNLAPDFLFSLSDFDALWPECGDRALDPGLRRHDLAMAACLEETATDRYGRGCRSIVGAKLVEDVSYVGRDRAPANPEFRRDRLIATTKSDQSKDLALSLR